MDTFAGKFRELLNKLTTRQKVQIAVALVTTVALILGISNYATRVRYGVLFSNLEREDAASVVAALAERQVTYRLTLGGSMIEVPVTQIDDLRMQLAGENLPRGGSGVGFEVFDTPAFGRSAFEQNVLYQRALERELVRTIRSLSAVDEARVHLALPEESVFADEKRNPTASVFLGLRSAGSLPTANVQAIANLVASAVEGLAPGDVSVVDGSGRLLSGSPDAPEQMLSASQLEAKRSMERSIESTLLSILEPIVGRGKVRSTATVELNMTRVTRQEETFDPDVAVVRSEQKQKSSSSSGGPGGAVGTASNLPGGSAQATTTGSGGETSQSTTQFELNRTVSNISEPVGTLARQSVAVVIDHAMITPPGTDNSADSGSAEAEEVAAVATPRTEEQMSQIRELVSAAIGIDVDRGDVLTVQNLAFNPTAFPDTAMPSPGLERFIPLARYLSLPLAVLLLAFFVIRPGIKAVGSLKAMPADSEEQLPPTVAHLQAALQASGQPGLDAGPPLRQRLIQAATEDPKTAALVVKNWLGQPADRG